MPQYNNTQFTQYSDSAFPNNNQGLITPAVLRAWIYILRDSFVNWTESVVTAISGASTDLQVPTAKAVYSFAQAKEAGKGLSANDYDNTEKGKVATAYAHSQVTGNPHGTIASEIDYTPANQDNTSGPLAGLIVAGKLKIKAALDRILALILTKADKLPAVVTITTNYTLTAADSNKILLFNSASDITLTLPQLPAGFQILWKQKGTGKILFAPSATFIEEEGNRLRSSGAKSTGSIWYESATVINLEGSLIV